LSRRYRRRRTSAASGRASKAPRTLALSQRQRDDSLIAPVVFISGLSALAPSCRLIRGSAEGPSGTRHDEAPARRRSFKQKNSLAARPGCFFD
jgi:hypothetical protein